MSGGSSRGRGKGKKNTWGWEGPLGPDFYEEALYERFPVESKSDFTKETPLRGYDERKEKWPKCMHGEDCLVQMFIYFFSLYLAWQSARDLWSSNFFSSYLA